MRRAGLEVNLFPASSMEGIRSSQIPAGFLIKSRTPYEIPADAEMKQKQLFFNPHSLERPKRPQEPESQSPK